MTQRTFLSGLVPVGYQTISLSNSTAIGVNSTCRDGRYLRFSVETNDARYRDDGTDPALTTGVLLTKANLYVFDGYNGSSALKFQRSTGICTIHLASYKFRPYA